MNNKIYILAGKLRTTYHKKINDTYIWTSIATSAIIEASANDEFLSKESIKVPTRSSKMKEIKRDKQALSNILEAAVKYDFNHSILTYLIAQIEAYFSDLIYGVLKIDNRRLKTKVNGINHTKTITVDEIINADSIESIIDELINKELISIFYASPEKQFEYLRLILGIEFDEKIEILFNKYIEYKASRDIVVHSSGIINDIYLKKSQENARGNIGDVLIIDENYLHNLAADSKSLIGKLSSALQKNSKYEETNNLP